MSDNTNELGDEWAGSESCTVGQYGTLDEFVLALEGSESSPLLSDWAEHPKEFAVALASELLDRYTDHEDLITEVVKLDDLQARAHMAYDNLEGHYALALAVVETVKVYVEPPVDAAKPYAALHALKEALAAFDAYDGPVQVDAIAGGRASVSVVPPYEGDDDGASTGPVEPPNLSVVPDPDEPATEEP